jgi:hypothetical protein
MKEGAQLAGGSHKRLEAVPVEAQLVAVLPALLARLAMSTLKLLPQSRLRRSRGTNTSTPTSTKSAGPPPEMYGQGLRGRIVLYN